ncbi:MAG: SGNH/GDSL hydrolase family protein [Candidatus Omnitrophota bacterium]
MKASIKNFLLLIFTVAVLFVIGEFVVRGIEFFVPFASDELPRPNSNYRADIETHPVLNHVHKPGLKFVHIARDGKEFRNEQQYNSKGLNDDEYEYDKTSDKSRIIILGDSFVDGVEVGRADNFCDVIEKKLSERKLSKKYEVINMGVSGYSPILEYLYLKKEGLKYNPDIVILCFFMNDVYEDSFYNGMATFDNNGLPTAVHFKGPPKIEKLKGWKRAERKFCNTVKGAINKSRFYVSLKKRLYVLLKKTGLKKSDPEANQFFILSGEPKAGEEVLWEDTFRYILGMKQLAGPQGAKFLLVIIPTEAQIEGTAMGSASKFYFKEKPDSKKVEDRLSQFCAKNKIDCVNLKDEFEKLPIEERNLYFPRDSHFNEKGHRETASIILEKLDSLEWIN